MDPIAPRRQIVRLQDKVAIVTGAASGAPAGRGSARGVSPAPRLPGKFAHQALFKRAS